MESNKAVGFSICFAAHNEEAVIEQKIQNLLDVKDITRGGVEILVYADGCEDATVEILRSFGTKITLVEGVERAGKSNGINQLLDRARMPVVVFTDANVMLDENALNSLSKYFEAAGIGCVCGHLRYTNERDSITAHSGSLYWRFEEWLKRLETDTGSTLMADGSIFAIRRELFRPVPVDIIDDMYTSLNILCDGYRVVRAHDVVAYEKGAVIPKEEFPRKVRITCRAFNCHRLLWPRIVTLSALDMYKYLSHKYLRWLTIYFLLGSIVFLLVGLIGSGVIWYAIISSAIIAILLVLGHLLRLPGVSHVAEMLSAFVATGVGVYRSYRGDRFQVWKSAGSSR